MEIQLLNEDCMLHILKYLSLLDIINLEDASKIFIEVTKNYFRTCKSFKCNIRNTQLENLTPIFQRIGPHLNSFEFSGGFNMQQDYKKTLFINLSIYCNGLKALSLNYVPLELCDLLALTSVTKNLENLNLGNCHIEDSNLNVFLSKITHLKWLTLKGNSMFTGECITQLNQLEKLDVSYCYILKTDHLCKFLRNCKSLKHLNISGSYMLDWKEILSVLVASQIQIKELFMTNLGIDRAQVPYESLKHLKVFDIHGTRLGT